MTGKRKEKIIFIEVKGTPVGNLFIAASKKGIVSLSLAMRSENKFLERERKRFTDSQIFINAGSIKWSKRIISYQKPSKSRKTLSLKLDKVSLGQYKNLKRHINIVNNTLNQLNDYFAGRLKRFRIKKDFKGLTSFEKKVLKELERIPCGSTSSYQEIARRIGKPRAYRAVGNAIGKNPFAILISCHRIIRSDGSIGGFSAPLTIKMKLLSHEKKVSHI